MPWIEVIERSGRLRRLEVRDGASILEIARQFGLEIEGTCEGCMACATCHVALDEASFAALPPPTDEEEDMLDLASKLEATSRLGCQVRVSRAVDGMRVRLIGE